MHETLDADDWSQYCDYAYEIDDRDKSSLSWAKQELRKLANENTKTTRESGSILNKVKSQVSEVCKDNSIKAKFMSIRSDMGGKGLGIDIGNNIWYEFFPTYKEGRDIYDAEFNSWNGDGSFGTDNEVLKDLINKLKEDLNNK